MTELAADAPIWETEVGQQWKRLMDSVRDGGDPASINVMLMLNKINNTRGGKNLIAPVLGYDTIKSGSVELVMSRSALITLDKTLGPRDLQKFFKRAQDVRAERKGRGA